MGPGNTSAAQADPSIPILANTAARQDLRGRAIARRIQNSSKRTAIEAGKLSNVPDDKTSFEGI